jgi:hypothetical protein
LGKGRGIRCGAIGNNLEKTWELEEHIDKTIEKLMGTPKSKSIPHPQKKKMGLHGCKLSHLVHCHV